MLKHNLLKLSVCAILGFVAPVETPGQEPNPKRQNITVEQGRPLYEAVKELRQRYGWLITYQDPPYEHPGDMMLRQGAPVRHMVPRQMRISVDYTEPRDESPEERRRTIEEVVEGFSAAGAGQFRVYHSGSFSHVAPVSVRKAVGSVEMLPSMCEVTVSFPPAMRTIDESLSLILQQVSQQIHATIARGAEPANLFLGYAYPSDAENERACDLMVRTFESANPKRVAMGLPMIHVLWAMLYDPTAKEYFYNAAIVEPPPAQPLNGRPHPAR